MSAQKPGKREEAFRRFFRQLPKPERFGFDAAFMDYMRAAFAAGWHRRYEQMKRRGKAERC